MWSLPGWQLLPREDSPRGVDAQLGGGVDFGPPAAILTFTLLEWAEAAHLGPLGGASDMDERDFRQRLHAITTDRDADLWLPDLRTLCSEYPHRIERADVDLNRGFNCFAYALGLCTSATYLAVASRSSNPNVHADSGFARWLLDRQLLQPRPQPGSGNVVIYFDDTLPTHAGVLQGRRVLSKWGTGFWFAHDLLEVPASYGSRTEFFAAPRPETVERQFLEFAAERGVPVARFSRT